MHPAPATTWHEIALRLSGLMEKFKTVIIVRLRQKAFVMSLQGTMPASYS